MLSEDPFAGQADRAEAIGANEQFFFRRQRFFAACREDMLFQRVAVDLSHIFYKRIVPGRVLQEICKIALFRVEPLCAVGQGLFPGIRTSDPPHDLRHAPRVIPGDQIVFVLEIAVEGRRRIPAVVRDILYRDLIYVFALRHLAKSLCKYLFCCFAFHSDYLTTPNLSGSFYHFIMNISTLFPLRLDLQSAKPVAFLTVENGLRKHRELFL